MARLITSDNALRTLLMLSQRDAGMRTSEVAAALEISYTGAEKALGILVADSLARVADHRFVLSDSIQAREAIRLAMAFLPASESVAALARGNDGVEFGGLDDDGFVIVLRRFVTLDSERRLRDALGVLEELVPGLRMEVTTKEALRDGRTTDPAQRERARAMTVLAGSLDRTFPDPARRGQLDAPPLKHLNLAVRVPSARRLRQFARHFGLRRIVAFGSATRADFRPDSDLDLVVEPAPASELGLTERADLIAEADRLFDRDVDVLVAPVRRASLAQRIARDGVVLYDASR